MLVTRAYLFPFFYSFLFFQLPFSPIYLQFLGFLFCLWLDRACAARPSNAATALTESFSSSPSSLSALYYYDELFSWPSERERERVPNETGPLVRLVRFVRFPWTCSAPAIDRALSLSLSLATLFRTRLYTLLADRQTFAILSFALFAIGGGASAQKQPISRVLAHQQTPSSFFLSYIFNILLLLVVHIFLFVITYTFRIRIFKCLFPFLAAAIHWLFRALIDFTHETRNVFSTRSLRNAWAMRQTNPNKIFPIRFVPGGAI